MSYGLQLLVALSLRRDYSGLRATRSTPGLSRYR